MGDSEVQKSRRHGDTYVPLLGTDPLDAIKTSPETNRLVYDVWSVI